ncbi:MAG TPA: hypothetical protein VFV17_02975 [Usitatibacteraceae bacterium]|nr:hypothetical protein [Usitatibacteraceae bacterium]
MNSEPTRRTILLKVQPDVTAQAGEWPVHEQMLGALAKQLSRAPVPGAGAPLSDAAAVLQRLVALAGDSDRQHGEYAPLDYEDVDTATDEALGALALLHAAGSSDANPAVPAQYAGALDRLAIAIGHWAMRHGIRCLRIEPVVNALARAANATTSRQETAAVFALMQGLIEHCKPDFGADLERSNPERPWRILNLNFAITAIRTGDAALMQFAFASLTSHLPDESRSFFLEAGETARTAGLPADLCDLIDRELRGGQPAQ